MESLFPVLNKQVANWIVLRMKLQNYHWNVKGPAFFTLHAKFEELYTEASLHIDTLAERILALHGKPLATLGDCLHEASIEEATDRENTTEMVKTLIEDFSIIIEELKDGIKKSDELGDESTADLLLSIQTSLEKHAWMFRALLG
ncbi:DNA starvation/stationary phase protection protein [Brevibacillus ruminantium]|uniref:DNA starvation/stationary phase protection protein n=1 Tax=Brevibacillus ruminantium TaxID=2950604 RepID=A0ABY4WF22_9BACL|nr:Dps family protein [Brevibacillus ruminantium]USG64592.1 DNA starvation/stationary phase protection protein [Brevibacillus ruminantium]